MITPNFTCSQDADSITLRLYVPSIRATEVSILVHGTSFTLNVNPYFLRLNFPSAVVEDERSAATYDPASGYMSVSLSKAIKGVDFGDLELLGKLLAPETSAAAAARPPVIEVIDDAEEEARKDWLLKERETLLEAERHNWHNPPSPPLSNPSLSTTPTHPYGFLNLHSSYFTRVTDTDNEVNICGPDAETLTAEERWERMREREEEKWDEEHYVADFMDDEMIKEVLAQPVGSPFSDLLPSQGEITLTDSDSLTLLQLPRRSYLLTPQLTRTLYLTLLPLLFATTYDALTTFSDPTSQSAWTITALSPPLVSLTALPADSTLHSALVASYRRALAYPLYRSWALCERVREETARVLERGRRGVVKVLLWMRSVLDAGGPYAAYARVWVDDYISWTQVHASDETLHELGREVREVVIEKGDVGWGLEELEQAALEAQGEEEEGDSDDEPEFMRPVQL